MGSRGLMHAPATGRSRGEKKEDKKEQEDRATAHVLARRGGGGNGVCEGTKGKFYFR